MKKPALDPYKVLHVSRSATPREVARAFRALVRTVHPDTKPAAPGPGDPGSAAQELQDIMDAYALLHDPARRAAYDRQWPAPTSAGRPLQPRGRVAGRVDLIIGPVRWERSSGRGG